MLILGSQDQFTTGRVDLGTRPRPLRTRSRTRTNRIRLALVVLLSKPCEFALASYDIYRLNKFAARESNSFPAIFHRGKKILPPPFAS
jgi:hypothetical protein